MFRLFKNFWPVFAIIFITLVFFYPVYLKGLVLLPADIITGVSFPYLDMKWSDFPSGVPVKNPITSDVVSFSYPMRMLGIDLLKQGKAPLWNEYILGGTPLLANFQSAPYSLTNIYYLFFDKIEAWNLQVITQLIVGALSMYYLLRYLKRSAIASIIAGLIFAFSGFMIIWLEWNAHSLVGALFPLIILISLRFLEEKRKVFWGSCLSVVLGFQILAGYPQIILYEFVAIFLLFFFFSQKKTKIFDGLFYLLFILLGIGLAAIQILPALELLSLSQRRFEVIPDQWTFLPLSLLITFFAPDYFGNHATYNYWGPANYTLNTGYSGIITFVLASLGFLKFRNNKFVIYAGVLILIAVLIAFSNPISNFIKITHFLGLQAGTSHRALILVNLGLAILSAFGLDTILKMDFKLNDLLKAISIPVLFLGFFGIYSFWMVHSSTEEIVINNFNIGIRNLGLPSLFLILVAFLVFINLRMKKQLLIGLLIGGLALSELFRFGFKYTPFSPREFIYPDTKTTEFLDTKNGPYRIVAEKVIPKNFMMIYKVETLEGYDAIYPLSTAKFLSVLNSSSVSNAPQDRYGAVSNLDSSFLNLANVKYFLKLKKDLAEKDQVIFEEKSVAVIKNPNALDRVQLYYDFEVIDDAEKTLSYLLKNPANTNKLVIEKDPEISPSIGSGKVDLGRYLEGIINIKTDKPALLYIANTFYPGWKVMVDGKEQRILRANYNFMAVAIKEGDHSIKLFYDPTSFKNGKNITLITLGLLLTINIFFFIVLKEKKISF